MKIDGVIKSPISGVIVFGLWAFSHSHLQTFFACIIIERLKIWFLFVIFALSTMLAGQVCAEVLTIQPGQRYIDVQKYFDYLEDPKGVFSYDDVSGGQKNLSWIENSHSGLNFGYTDSVIWVKGTVVNSSLKETAYVFYVFFMTLWAASLNGISFQYLWPEATVWNDQVIIFALNGIIFFASMFAARFLDVKQAYPVNYRLFLTLPTVSFVMMMSAYFIPYRAGISFAMIVAVVTILYGSAITLKRLFDGFKLAWVFILAWAMVLCGGVVMALSKFALLPRNMVTETAVQIGSVFEVALLSFALAHRLNLEKKQRIEAQNIANIHERHARIAKENELLNERKVRTAREEALSVQKRTTETLERKIFERRTELNENSYKVRVTHDKIMESLAYDRIIQSAMLPEPEDFSFYLPGHFIWYAPRDIVGGDFYYVDAVEQGVIVVVADCTGHGVP